MRLLPIALAGLCLAAAVPAAAQDRDRYGGYGDSYRDHDGYRGDWRDDRYRQRDWNAVPSTFDWRSQLDRPGDYRCDAFWDASRTDCGARWRDQRHRVSPQARRDYRELAGYRHDGYGRYDYGRYDYGYGYGYDRYGHGYDRYSSRRRGYGSAYGSGGTAYHGAYGRPDVVYPSGGYSAGGRDPGRIAWCRATYRSYDPASGYYRAWSGRRVWCG
jgi:hypothetical protein